MSTVQQFDTSVDLMKAILWQYDSADRLKSIVAAKQAWVNQNQARFWSEWYRDVFNVDTATRFGLAVWGRILNVKTTFVAPPRRGAGLFGFGANNKNFEHGNFGSDTDSGVGLTLEQQRIIIKMRYFQLTSRCTIPEVNEFLAKTFGDLGTVFVVDSYDMSFVTYIFTFTPNSQLQFILNEYDLLPRPAAVGVRWRVIQRPVFGFGVENLNFNNGNFGA